MKGLVKMNYRMFGKTGTNISALGFGAMRLPTKDNASDIDEAQAIEMIRYRLELRNLAAADSFSSSTFGYLTFSSC